MLPIPNYVLLFSVIFYAIIIIIDLALYQAIKRCLIEGIILVIILALLHITTGFPIPKQAFGDVAPILAIGIMFLSTLLGMIGRYIFYKKGGRSWRSFLKPLGIAPIIFLPLIGTVKGVTKLDPIQLISLAVLAYQTGFFWKERFDNIVTKERQLKGKTP